MYARVNRFQGSPDDDVDAITRAAREQLVPRMEAIPGFLGMQSLVNRDTGETLAITFWESEEALRASEAEAARVRAAGTDISGSEIRSVERYEVVLRVGL